MKKNEVKKVINNAMKVLKPSDSVRTLHVMCYKEQLKFSWKKIQNMIRNNISTAEFQVLAICHDRDEAKKHYHFIIKVLGNAKKAVSTLLEMVGVQFRETDQELWNNGGVTQCRNFAMMSLYLTHETPQAAADGKLLYPEAEIISNLAPAEVAMLRSGEGTCLTVQDKVFDMVLFGGMTIKEVMEKYPRVYRDYYRKLEDLRNRFLMNQPMPKQRLNIYVGGDGSGLGKTLFCKMLAKVLADPDDRLATEDELIFQVKKKTGFNGYKGQPVLMWDDFRPLEVLKAFEMDKGALFNFLNPYPGDSDGVERVLYGTTRLVHKINIFDSPLDPKTWLDGIAGEYDRFDGTHIEAEDVRIDQICRRIPIATFLDAEGYTIMENRGVVNGTSEWGVYNVLAGKIRGNLHTVISTLGAGEDYDRIARKFVAPAEKECHDVEEKMACQRLTAEEKTAFVANQMETIGTVMDEELDPFD